MDAYKLTAYYCEQWLYQVKNVNGEVQGWGNHEAEALQCRKLQNYFVYLL